jgi:hypothetical protein
MMGRGEASKIYRSGEAEFIIGMLRPYAHIDSYFLAVGQFLFSGNGSVLAGVLSAKPPCGTAHSGNRHDQDPHITLNIRLYSDILIGTQSTGEWE